MEHDTVAPPGTVNHILYRLARMINSSDSSVSNCQLWLELRSGSLLARACGFYVALRTGKADERHWKALITGCA